MILQSVTLDFLTGIIVPFLIFGLGYFLGDYRKRGKVEINNLSIDLKYHGQGFDNWIHTIEISFQFLNNANLIKQVEILWADFSLGSMEENLIFENSKFPPIYVLKEKSAVIETLNLKFQNGKIVLPIKEINEGSCVIRVSMKINDKAETISFNSRDFKLIDTSFKVVVG